MFERENAFYQAHQAELREKYLDKWLVIAGDSLIGAFDLPKEAFEAAAQHQCKPGEFMLHKPADDGAVLEIGPSGTGIIQLHRPGDTRNRQRQAVITTTSGERSVFTYGQ